MRKHLRKMYGSAGRAVKFAKMCAPDRTEAYRNMGICYWVSGKHSKALRWWKKSIDEGERLGAKLELSRTYFEVGKRTFVGGAGRNLLLRVKKHIGLTPEECLDRAELMFKEMDLQWDLAELAKVRQKNNHP